MKLETRTVAAILAVQALIMTTAFAVLIQNARGAVEVEIASAMQATRSLLNASVETLSQSMDADAVIRHLPGLLAQPRHLRITVNHAADVTVPIRDAAREADDDEASPAWFYRLIAPPIYETRFPILQDGRVHGIVLLTSHPQDEVAEIWEDMVVFFVMVFALIVALTLATMAILRVGLRPLAQINEAIDCLARGDFSPRGQAALVTGDLSATASNIDRLTETLRQGSAERQVLSRQVVQRGDEERKALARDLHDEYGPILFSLRAQARSIRDTSADPESRSRAGDILETLGRMTQKNRSILTSLRPAALGQLPLADVLRDMIGDLASHHPDIEWEADSSGLAIEPGETAALTLYRALQEATTNAMRHAKPSRVTATIWNDDRDWHIKIVDDGAGMPRNQMDGAGLSGMKERVALLNGRMVVRSGLPGTCVHVSIPLEDRQ